MFDLIKSYNRIIATYLSSKSELKNLSKKFDFKEPILPIFYLIQNIIKKNSHETQQVRKILLLNILLNMVTTFLIQISILNRFDNTVLSSNQGVFEKL